MSQPRDRSLSAQPISFQKAQLRKIAHKPLRTLCISQTNMSAMFDDHQILLFLLHNKQTFCILSLRDLLFVFSSLVTCPCRCVNVFISRTSTRTIKRVTRDPKIPRFWPTGRTPCFPYLVIVSPG